MFFRLSACVGVGGESTCDRWPYLGANASRLISSVAEDVWECIGDLAHLSTGASLFAHWFLDYAARRKSILALDTGVGFV